MKELKIFIFIRDLTVFLFFFFFYFLFYFLFFYFFKAEYMILYYHLVNTYPLAYYFFFFWSILYRPFYFLCIVQKLKNIIHLVLAFLLFYGLCFVQKENQSISILGFSPTRYVQIYSLQQNQILVVDKIGNPIYKIFDQLLHEKISHELSHQKLE